MRRTLLPVLLLALTAAGSAQQSPAPEWDDVKVLHVGTEKPHVTMMTYPSAELAKAAEPGKSPWYRSLNGEWKFHASPSPAARPADFFRVGYDDSSWNRIRVPGSVCRRRLTASTGSAPPVFVMYRRCGNDIRGNGDVS